MERYSNVLREIFPYTSHHIINDIITMVEEQNPNDSFEGKIENMINLLSGDGAQGPMPEIRTDQNTTLPNELDPTKSRLYQDLVTLFPNAKPEYVLAYCRDKAEDFDFNDAIDEFSEGYEKIEKDPITIWESLQSALPDADPSYLRKEAERLVHLDVTCLDEFVQNAITQNDLPSMHDYIKRKKEQDERSKFINFNIEKFIEQFPNPFDTFSDPNRKLPLDENSNETDINYALNFLYNQYPLIRKINIEQVFDWNQRNLIKTCEHLEKISKNMRRARDLEQSPEIENLPLLQEIAFVKHRKMIKNFLKTKDEYYRIAREEARREGLLETCQCCFDDELIPEECFFCRNNHVFCKECMNNGIKNIIGNGELKFPCFAGCNSEFSLQTLRMVLPGNIFEKLAQKIASEEIKKANLEGLETCPFCDFAMILPDEEKIFKCINEDCGIESCRECKHKTHIPLKCDEVEYDEDVRRRTYIENKMTEALTRTCYKCNKTFIKTNGCNKMTCFCGAKMCYLCGAAVNDYSHFNGSRCPLFTNDTEINLNRIMDNANKAKQELGNVKIKFDPTKDIQNYYPV